MTTNDELIEACRQIIAAAPADRRAPGSLLMAAGTMVTAYDEQQTATRRIAADLARELEAIRDRYGDTEINHENADKLLLKALADLGVDVAEVYGDIEKWYA